MLQILGEEMTLIGGLRVGRPLLGGEDWTGDDDGVGDDGDDDDNDSFLRNF
jgi:hypothetical protein